MAAKDLYHDHVRKALENDGWTVTDDPYGPTPNMPPPESRRSC
ncbi:MAG: element excision factor XisH family protein [Blastocatellia bacterium]